MNLRKFVRELPIFGKFALSLYVLYKRGSSLRIFRPHAVLSNFWPNSDGKFSVLTGLLLSSINRMPSYFDELIGEVTQGAPEKPKHIEQLVSGDFASNSSKLRNLFQKYESDKHTHKYEDIYCRLFENFEAVTLVVEIGIGTNNERVVSHMGRQHKGSGGSLRAFRDYFPNARVIGLDIDREALFQEERISTFFFDQNGSTNQLRELGVDNSSVDLFIDDGLHLFGANVKGLIHGLRSVKEGGWIAIEDLTDGALGAWRLISIALNANGHEAHLIQAQGAYVLLVRKAPFLGEPRRT